MAMGVDPDAFRGGLEIFSCLALPAEVFARPGFAQRVLEAAADRAPTSWPGPDREQLMELVSPGGARAEAL